MVHLIRLKVAAAQQHHKILVRVLLQLLQVLRSLLAHLQLHQAPVVSHQKHRKNPKVPQDLVVMIVIYLVEVDPEGLVMIVMFQVVQLGEWEPHRTASKSLKEQIILRDFLQELIHQDLNLRRLRVG